MDQTADINAFWEDLGVPELSLYEEVVGAAANFLSERGYSEDVVWVEGYRHNVLRVSVLQSQYRFFCFDVEDLIDVLRAHDPLVELRVLRRKAKTR